MQRKFDYNKNGAQNREFTLDASAIDIEARTVEVAFSSEKAVSRWWGNEILDHESGAADLERFNDGAPVLLNHDTNKVVGVIESARVDSDRVGRAVLRFGKSELAQEILEDIRDGIRPHISFAYEILEARLEAVDGETKDETWRIVRWRGLEISSVPIPADETVGVGRSAASESQKPEPQKRGEDMDPKQTDQATLDKHRQAGKSEGLEEGLATGRSKGAEDERKRVADILEMGSTRNAIDQARAAIAEGKSTEEFARFLLTYEPTPVDPTAGDLGLDEKDLRQFSVLRLMRSRVAPDNKAFREAASFEYEVCDEAAKKRGISEKIEGVYLPFEALQRSSSAARLAQLKRDMTVGTAADGGNLVGTDLLGSSFIDLLRDESILMEGATVLNGLTGDVALPRMTSGATAYWLAEAAAATESTPQIDQVSLSPNTLMAAVDLSKKLIAQSSIDVEMQIRLDMAGAVLNALEAAAINGSGTGAEPEGILQKSIGAVALGANGAAPTWASVVELEAAIANANLRGNLGYVTNGAGRGALKSNFRNATYGDRALMEGSDMNGYGVRVTDQVPSNLTKGSGTGLSALIFGNWRDLLFGFWGGMDLVIDPLSQHKNRLVGMSLAVEVDVNVRREGSFAAVVDMVTS
jgi:HK97 family phage major capsid protein